jgi:hypothetical protein
LEAARVEADIGRRYKGGIVGLDGEVALVLAPDAAQDAADLAKRDGVLDALDQSKARLQPGTSPRYARKSEARL